MNHLKLITVFIITLLVIFYRSYTAFRYPILLFEDGKIMLAFYMNNPDPAGVFRYYNGYISLLPNIVGYVSTLFPVTVYPYVMGIYSLLLSAFSFCLFSLKRFRFIIGDDNTRMAISLFLVSLSLGNFAKHSSATFSSWHLLWIYLMLSLAPLPQGAFLTVMHGAFLFLAAWSHPLSLSALPLLFILVLVRKTIKDRIFAFYQIILLLSYYFLGIQSNHIKIPHLFPTIGITIRYILRRVLFESIAGKDIRFRLTIQNRPFIMDCIAILVILLAIILFLRIKKSMPVSARYSLLWFCIMIFGLTWMSVTTREFTEQSEMGSWSQRYFYLQQIMTILILAILAATSMQHFRSKFLNLSIVTLMLGLVFFQNVTNRQYFRTSIEEGMAVRKYLRSLRNGKNLADYLDANSGKYVLDRGGVWDIKINASAITPKGLPPVKMKLERQKKELSTLQAD